MTEVTAEPLSEAADGRERGAEKYAGSLYNYKTKRRDEKKKGGMIAMKKFLSMVMAAAMVVSLVPATAFAANNSVSAAIMDAKNYTKPDGILVINGPELRLRASSNFVTSTKDEENVTTEVTLTLDNAWFDANKDEIENWTGDITIDDGDAVYDAVLNNNGDAVVFKDGAVPLMDRVTDQPFTIDITDTDIDDGKLVEVTFEITGRIYRGWDLYFDLESTMDKTSKGKNATVTVDSGDLDITNGDELVYASVEDESISVSVKDTVDVAEDEVVTLKDITIEAGVGNFNGFAHEKDELTLKLNNGFEFVEKNLEKAKLGDETLKSLLIEFDDDEIVLKVSDKMVAAGVDEWKIKDLQVDSADAKAGAVATLRVSLEGCDTVSTEVANVVEYDVILSVDEDEDVPVIYSGVDVDNTGITDDSDHESLEVTLKETFAGAWNNSKDFTLSVPEGVYITNVEGNIDNDGDVDKEAPDPDVLEWFEAAYEEGDYVELTFDKRSWSETDPDNEDDPIELNFTLTLVADPNFEGDVVLKLSGDAMEEQEVTIAKFVKTFTVTAEQNDMKIDYRNTEIPTSVVITEAEAGLWDKDTVFNLVLDRIDFDDEGTITIDDKSGLEVEDDEVVHHSNRNGNDYLTFEVSSRSDDEPASVTISGMQLYMDRSLPAGAYDLDVYSETMLYGEDTDNRHDDEGYLDQTVLNGGLDKDPISKTEPRTIADINDDFYSTTAKAGFVNIVTAGREDDDSSFTTKVVVPVGENYLIAGENQIALDVPAYISADGYTMLPIRAVAYALGINTNSVLWDQPSRTVTIMYGSRIISMQNGQSVMYVSGQAIPMSAAVEIVDGRAFIPMRDLGVALGVSDIVWDASTRTATLNGSK